MPTRTRNLVSVDSIGKSHEGRDIWVVTLTNTATGAAIDKPAFWCDGNIHAAELTASTAVLYYRTSSSAATAAMRRPRGCSTRARSTCARA